MRFASVRLLFLLAVTASLACTVDRSVRAWIESRATDGTILAGAVVEIDGQPSGVTDARGLYAVKIRRKIGDRVTLRLYEEDSRGGVAREWNGSFTVGTAGTPVETHGGRLTATLAAEKH